MSMGKRKRDRQPAMWVTATNLPTAASHPFYRRLNQLLREHGSAVSFSSPIRISFEHSIVDYAWTRRRGMGRTDSLQSGLNRRRE
jgi:hypothetical protein